MKYRDLMNLAVITFSFIINPKIAKTFTIIYPRPPKAAKTFIML